MKYRIGIDLGGTAIKAGVVDGNYQILAKRTIRTCPDFETACREMGDLVKDLLQDTQISPSDLESVGIGTPALSIRKAGSSSFPRTPSGITFRFGRNWASISRSRFTPEMTPTAQSSASISPVRERDMTPF